jgi:VCBS repeat-containing protein/probable HAF family extracellular repeat protein
MAQPNKVSFGNTPQADDDFFSSAVTGLTEDSRSTVYLDVLGNDLGGAAKSLWSVDNGVNNSGAMNGYSAADLLTQDAGRTEATSTDTSLHGARIWITADGKIGYDASTLDASFRAQLQALGDGQYATDTFVYAIRLGNGTLSWATATVQFAGINDPPTLAPIPSITFNDTAADDSFAPVNGVLSASDPEHETLTFGVVGGAADNSLAGYNISEASLYGTLYLNSASGAYTFVPNDSAIQALKSTTAVDFNITVSDGALSDSKTLTVTLNGVNDTASITGAGTGDVTEDGTLTTGGVVAVQDRDAGDDHFQAPAAGALTGTYGVFSFDPNTGLWGYTLNNAAANVQALLGTDVRHDYLTVTSADGTATQTIDVSIHGTYDVTFVADGTVDPSATKASTGHPNEIISGSGIPASHFGLVEVTDAGIELGMQIIYRQGPVVTTTDNYDDGVLHFTVNEGAQSTANGSLSNNANRAAWNFDYSIATGLDGQSTDLSNYAFKLLVDVDPSSATNYHTLEMVGPGAPNATGYVWVDDSVSASGPGTLNGHPIVIGDDGGNANVAQNSENYAFGFIQNYLTSAYGPANNFSGPAHLDLVLEAYDSSANLVAQNHIVVDMNGGAAAHDFTTVDSAGAANSYLVDINDSGELLGYTDDGSGDYHGFTYQNGMVSPENDPSASGRGTHPNALNGTGEIVGDFWGAPDNFYGVNEGFMDIGGNFAEMNPLSAGAPGYPPSYQTSPKDVNDSGQVVGFYAGSFGDGHGFLYSNGQYTELKYNGVSANPSAINNNGDVVGRIYDYGINHWHGLLYSGGNYTTPALFDAPGAADTYPAAINATDEIAGTFTDSSGHDHGFTLQNGQYTILDVPGAINTDVGGVSAINDAGTVVGSYEDSAHVEHGFVYSNGAFATVDDPLATTGTQLVGINNLGQVIGNYQDANGWHGFAAKV